MTCYINKYFFVYTYETVQLTKKSEYIYLKSYSRSCLLFESYFKEDQLKFWCHDTQHNDTHHNDTQRNGIQHNDTQHYDDNYHNETQEFLA